eukprot:880327-Rhodomonas_salina.1
MQCPVLTYAMPLRLSYAMSGTDILYAATRRIGTRPRPARGERREFGAEKYQLCGDCVRFQYQLCGDCVRFQYQLCGDCVFSYLISKCVPPPYLPMLSASCLPMRLAVWYSDRLWPYALSGTDIGYGPTRCP